MRLLKAAKNRCDDYDQRARDCSSRIVTYPPPSTGTNYNLIDKIEHSRGDRVMEFPLGPKLPSGFEAELERIYDAHGKGGAQ